MTSLKSWMTVVALVVVIIGAHAVAEELQNGGFEEADPSPENTVGDRAAHWGRWGHWINRETGWTPTRDGACLIGYHHWQINEDISSGIYQDIPSIPAGKRCLFSVFAMIDDNTNAESVELRLEQYKGGETLASKMYSMESIGRGGWAPLSVDGTNVTQGVRVLVIVTPKTGPGREGAVKFDDAHFAYH